MITGGSIMIIGVVLQIAAVKGHKAMAQFVIGRIITGVGNGINTSVCLRGPLYFFISRWCHELTFTRSSLLIKQSAPALLTVAC